MMDGHARVYAGTPFGSTHCVVLTVLIFLMPIMCLGIVGPSFLLLSLAACSLAVMSLPFFGSKRIDWFSPWTMACYSVIYGLFVRSIAITFDIPDSASIQRVFLLGESKEFLLIP